MQSFHVLVTYRTTRGVREWATTVDAVHFAAAYSKAVAEFRKRRPHVRIDHATLHSGPMAESRPGVML
jgi:hypothetical protein